MKVDARREMASHFNYASQTSCGAGWRDARTHLRLNTWTEIGVYFRPDLSFPPLPRKRRRSATRVLLMRPGLRGAPPHPSLSWLSTAARRHSISSRVGGSPRTWPTRRPLPCPGSRRPAQHCPGRPPPMPTLMNGVQLFSSSADLDTGLNPPSPQNKAVKKTSCFKFYFVPRVKKAGKHLMWDFSRFWYNPTSITLYYLKIKPKTEIMCHVSYTI